jgi:uncharacterized protein (AIM24 family)
VSVDVKMMTTSSGWSNIPSLKDMSRLQFGSSFCQIEGNYVPVADINHSASDSVYFAHHVLLWKDTSIELEAMSLNGIICQFFLGTPKVMAQARGPGHLAFSKDSPGELIPLPLQPGEKIDVREHLFMVGSGTVKYDQYLVSNESKYKRNALSAW